jgi:ADP-ribose pyrophosphatase YjhB (NUDIX family)
VKDVAVVAILDRSERVLLVRQSYGRRWWGLPGGEIEQNETPEGAAHREVEEEVGLDVRIGRLVGQYTLHRPSGRTIVHVYAANDPDGPIRLDPSEVEEAEWFAADEVAAETNDVLRLMVSDAARGASELHREITVEF